MFNPLIAPVLAPLLLAAAGAGEGPDLKKEGVYGFPQASATVLCDTADLRLSAATDGDHLYIQAILWKDGSDKPGETSDGRAIGDRSCLVVDVDADGKVTPSVDRKYYLNPWPQLPGLHFATEMGGGGSTGLQGTSRGRGSISYIPVGDAKVRVDCFLIPIPELQRKLGEPVRFAYHANSTAPESILNSVGFESAKNYYASQLPHEKFHSMVLAKGGPAIDAFLIPEGRDTIEVKPQAKAPLVGEFPPPVAAEGWLNWSGKEPPSLESLKGRVVVVEFWATWCAPCIAGIPHLNELHDKHAKDGMVLLSLTDQSRQHVEEFAKERGMRYTIGVGSKAAEAYGVGGIPHAFVIGRDGKLVWFGHPAREEFDKAIREALKQGS